MTAHEHRLICIMQRLLGWRLTLIFSVAILLATQLIVALADLLLKGAVLPIDLLIGLITAGLVTPPSIALINYLLLTYARHRRQGLAHDLAKSEELNSAIVSQAGDGIDLSDAKTLCFVEINEAACRMLGYAREELCGQPLSLIQAEFTADALRAAADRVLASGQASFETRYRRKDGSVFDIQLNVRVLNIKGRELLVSVWRDITQHRQSATALRESLLLLRSVTDSSLDAIISMDQDGRVMTWNHRAEVIFGYTEEQAAGREVAELIVPAAYREAHRQGVARFIKTGSSNAIIGKRTEIQAMRADGSEFPVEITVSAPRWNEMQVFGAYVRDITERKQAEEKRQLAASVFTHANEAITITAPDGTIIDVNDAFTRITGYSRAEVLGKNPRILSSGRQGPTFYAEMWHSLTENGHWHGEIWNRRKSGEIFAERLTISAVRDAQGATQHYVGLFSDITILKEHEKQLEHIAHYDALTTLPNRVLLADRLRQGMAQTQRREQRLAVACLDLDGFKAINDLHGHEAGDQLLIGITAHMKEALREGDTLARIGGDEFVAVLLDLNDVAGSMPLLARLLAAASEPVLLGERSLQVSASLGVTFYPQTEVMDPDQLLRQADQAMYQAKLAGKNRYHIFDAEHDRSIRGRHENLEHIRRALAKHEFMLHYQPKVNMRTGTVIGVEALIRWQHPERGLLSPGVFLPIIEDHPLAVDLGEWVIDAALTQMECWQAAGLHLPVSVNISARQLQQPDFVQRLRGLLTRHPRVPAGNLELEVLETSALEDLAHITETINTCQELGVGFAMDDFGTGYSSLTYLKRLPVTLLKIDQSFVRDMLDDPDDLAILEGVIGLAMAFRRAVIAEGVETTEHGELLLRLGCELGQGHGIARPMPAARIADWIASWRPDDSWARQAPVHRRDLPLIFAGVEHRAWITLLERYLRGNCSAPPPRGSPPVSLRAMAGYRGRPQMAGTRHPSGDRCPAPPDPCARGGNVGASRRTAR